MYNVHGTIQVLTHPPGVKQIQWDTCCRKLGLFLSPAVYKIHVYTCMS